MSPMLATLLETLGWSVFGIILLYLSLRLYDFLDPINYREEIRKGNLAAGALAAAVTVAIAVIIVGVILSP